MEAHLIAGLPILQGLATVIIAGHPEADRPEVAGPDVVANKKS